MDAFYNSNEVDSLLNVVESPELPAGISTLYKKINLPVVFSHTPRKGKDGKWVMELSSKVPLSLRTRVRRLGGFLSGGYLYYSFGIAPVLSDMRKVSKLLDTYVKDAKRAAETAGKDVSVRRSVEGSYAAFATQGASVPDGGFAFSPLQGGYWNGTIKSSSLTPKMTCNIRGIRDHKYMTETFQSLDNLIRKFGGVGPATFAWERIPFSFVLDWFVDCSGALNALDNLLTGNTKKIKGACISRKWEAHVAVNKIQRIVGETDSNDGSEIAECILSHYSRHSVEPSIVPVINNRFGKKQASITAALVGSYAANLKRKR
jgi:hypothetical protein